MKELTIEEKAKAYDEAIEKAKIFKEHLLEINDKGYVDEMDYIFPELKESVENEDEKIRKHLITLFKDEYGKNSNARFAGIKVKDIIAWLEKKGEQPIVDKAEPKFKVGDWIIKNDDSTINIDYSCCKITKVENGNYTIESIYGYKGYNTFDTFEKDFHIWTIQDARDGDVLACNNGWTCIFKTLVNDETFSSYCFMDNTKWFCETGCECHTLEEEFVKAYNGTIYPATKEQRDTFFAKMREAGYEWDAEKKELKKIEQKPIKVPKFKVGDFIQFNGMGHTRYTVKEVCGLSHYINTCNKRMDMSYTDANFELVEQKHTEWSEEDEEIYRKCICAMRASACGFPEEEKFVEQVDKWLKSLRPQSQWRPSEEMLEALYRAIPENTMAISEDEMLLDKLYQGLKYGRVLSNK